MDGEGEEEHVLHNLFLESSNSNNNKTTATTATETHDDDWKSLMLSSTITSFVLPPPPPVAIEIAPPAVRDVVLNLISRVIARSAAHTIVLSALEQSTQGAVNLASFQYSLLRKKQSVSNQPDHNGNDGESGADTGSDSGSFSDSNSDSDSASNSESEDENNVPTFTGTSKYVDNTDWHSKNVVQYTNGNMYIGDTNENQKPHGMGKMRRQGATSRKVRSHHNRKGVRKIDDILQVADHGKEKHPTPHHGTMSEFFDGSWVNGKFVHGLWRVQSGDAYEGHFLEWMFHGQGTYKWGDGETYTGDWICGRRHGHGQYLHIDGSVYEGDFLDNKENGKGVKKWHGGEQTYDGHWKDGMMHGQGRLTFSNGGFYEGEFAVDQRSGKGELQWNNGFAYSGMWENDQMSGLGVITSLVGKELGFGGTIVFKGSFKNGKKHGEKGIELFEDGAKYEGAYSFGVPHGYGIWEGPELRPYAAIVRRESYEGEFENGTRTGRGKMTTFVGTFVGYFLNDVPHGENHFQSHIGDETFHGNYNAGLKHGNGVWEGRNGSRYEGEWHSNKKQGNGVWTNHKGQTYSGVFIQGVLEGPGQLVNANGHGGYEGGFRKGLYHGQGILVGQSSPLDKYSGSWVNGKRHGLGEQSYENGSRYVGAWSNDVYEGNGELYGYDQHFLNVYRGLFEQGLPHGHGLMRWNTGTQSNIYEGKWLRGQPTGEGLIIWPNGTRFEGIFGTEETKVKLETETETETEPTIETRTFEVAIRSGTTGSYIDASGRRMFGKWKRCVIREGTPSTLKKNTPKLLPRRPREGTVRGPSPKREMKKKSQVDEDDY